MKKFCNCILASVLWLVSVMPMWMIYGMSFVTYFFVYYVFRYRRRAVYANLRESFPEKSRKEIRLIAREFYLNFVEYFFEAAKMPRMSARQMSRHMTFENIDLVRNYLREGRPVIGFYAHTGNWEWVTFTGECFNDIPAAVPSSVYRPLKNKWFDAYMLRIRTHFNAQVYPKATVFRDLVRLIKSDRLPFCVFMSDQKPSHGDEGRVVMFLNHPTAFITGTETVARRLEAPAVFLDMTKISRGHYHVRIVPMSDNVAETPVNHCTDMYARLLEENIRRQPSIWLWSHKRWKHKVAMPEQ